MEIGVQQWEKMPEVSPEFDSDLEVIEVDQLPSNFRPYKVNKIFLRGLTFGEVKMLSKITGALSSDLLVRIYRGIIKGIDPLDLTPLDLKAIILLTSYYTNTDHNLVLTTQCPKCGKPHVENVNIMNMDFGELPEANQQIELEEGEVLTFHPILMKHTLRVETLLKPRALDYLEDERLLERGLDAEILYALFSVRPDLWNLEDSLIVDRYFEFEGIGGGYASRILKNATEAHPDLEPLSVQCSGCDFRFQAEVFINPFASSL